MELIRIARNLRAVLRISLAALTLSAGAWLAAVGAAASVPAKDTFTGKIVSGVGKLANDRGGVTILIHAPQSTKAARPIQLAIESPACASKQHCLRLLGSLSGTMSAQRTIPDVGRRYSLQASGRIAPLGHVSASGVLTGVGFIRQGHEGLRLILRTSQGQLTISAISPQVPGFTSP